MKSGEENTAGKMSDTENTAFYLVVFLIFYYFLFQTESFFCFTKWAQVQKEQSGATIQYMYI